MGEQDYVCLPSRSSGSPDHHFPVGAAPRQEPGGLQQCPLVTGQVTDEVPDLREPLREASSSSSSPPGFSSGAFTGWPQGVSVQTSGYCQLPTGHT